MILALNTSSGLCRLFFIETDSDGKELNRISMEWEANRELAKGLLGYMQTQLAEHGFSWTDVTGLIVYQGPGSFTGLRIGITVMNSLAYANGLPVVGQTGDAWIEEGSVRLARGETDEIVLPEYGAEANITQPRK